MINVRDYIVKVNGIYVTPTTHCAGTTWVLTYRTSNKLVTYTFNESELCNAKKPSTIKQVTSMVKHDFM